jgi:O-antigen/teichoic acid export membrane protein
LATALGISLILGVTLAIVFFLSAGPLAAAFHEPRLKTVIVIMSMNFIFVAFAAIGTARLHRDMNFTAGLRIGILSAVVHAGTSILFAWHGYGAVGMAWASVMGILVYLVGNYVCYARDLWLVPHLAEWRRVLGFGVLSSGGYLLQEVGQRVADVVVGRFLGFGAAGLFSRANGLVSLFQQSLMNAIAPVALSSLAQLSRSEKDLKSPFLQLLSYTTLTAWPLLGMIALLALPIIRVAFGEQWLPATGTARILCLAAAIAVLGRVAVTLFTAMGAARRLFTVQLAVVPFLVGAVILGALRSIEAAAVGTVLGSLALAVISLHQVNHLVGTSWPQIAHALGASLAVTVLCLGLPVALICGFGVTSAFFWPQTLAAGISGVVIWVGCLFALRHPFRLEILLFARHGAVWLRTLRGALS